MNGVEKAEANTTQDLWSTSWPVADQPLCIAMGDLTLTISRRSHEWQMAYAWTKKTNSRDFSCRYIDQARQIPGPPTALDRIAMESMSHEIRLTPQLANRPLVVRPYAPLLIPANNRITLFVSAPLWLCVNFSAQLKKELPVQQLSDSWMGSKTGEGELCYGLYTHARLDKEALLKLPYRALTPVTMHNRGSEDFTLERLSIPAPYLSLYEGEGQLVTEPITIIMDPEKNQGTVKIGKLKGVKSITQPRKKTEKGVLVRTWETLFA